MGGCETDDYEMGDCETGDFAMVDDRRESSEAADFGSLGWSAASPSESSAGPRTLIPPPSQLSIFHGDRELDLTSAQRAFEVAKDAR